MVSVKAWIDGLGQVLRAPALVLAVLVVTVVAAVPFGVALRGELDAALAHQPAIDTGATEIDADWWTEFHAQATGLAATFTPTVIGFAAPLDNLSSLLDGTRRPLILVLPALIGVFVWAYLWGVALQRFSTPNAVPLGRALVAGTTTLPSFLLISTLAAVAQLVLYATWHPLLLDVIYPSVVSRDVSEPVAFAIRVVFYAVFWIPVAVIGLLADYTRIALVAGGTQRLKDGAAVAARFINRHRGHVIALYGITGLVFALAFLAYGIVDTVGASRVGGWRGVALGQGFVFARLVLRLTTIASALSLFRTLRD